MRNRLGNLVWGLLFIAIGIGFAGHLFKLWNFSLFFNFNGWWTLFIIIPCILSMIQHNVGVGNVVGLSIGVLLLLSAQNLISHDIIWKLVLAILFISIGFHIIFGNKISREWKGVSTAVSKDGIVDYTAVFSGQDIVFPREAFNGSNMICVFGGITLDLRNAVMDHDALINVTTVFGGADIIVPSNVKVKVTGTPIAGGISNKARPISDEDGPTLYVSGICVFGGVEIK